MQGTSQTTKIVHFFSFFSTVHFQDPIDTRLRYHPSVLQWTSFCSLPIMKINHLGESHRVPQELKTTVNLPKTGFPMKANLPQNEPKLLARWQEMGIYERIQEARKGLPSYV